MSSSRSSRRQSENSPYTVMDRSDDRSRQDSRMIREDLPMLSIHEDEPSRYDSRAPQESRTSSMGDNPYSRTATASRYESRAPQDSRYASRGDTQQSRTPTYMDPSKPLVIERAPATRHRSRASSSQMTDMDPMQTVMERSRDNAHHGDRHDVSHVYEEVTIRITRKISHRSSHRG